MPRQPRDWLVDRSRFGRKGLEPKDWKQPRAGSTSDRVGLLAAQMQHEIARLVRARRNDVPLYEALGEQTDASVDRLGKVLRGAAPMTVRQLADLTEVFGVLVKGLAD